jgi:hypothetical protein
MSFDGSEVEFSRVTYKTAQSGELDGISCSGGVSFLTVATAPRDLQKVRVLAIGS